MGQKRYPGVVLKASHLSDRLLHRIFYVEVPKHALHGVHEIIHLGLGLVLKISFFNLERHSHTCTT